MPRVTGAKASYTNTRLGPLGRCQELINLWRYQTTDVPRRMGRVVADLDGAREGIEKTFGAPLRDLDVLVIGPGQQLFELCYFARDNRVVGIDQDVVPRRWRDYFELYRRNGALRATKTVGRKLAGVDRGNRRELFRRLGLSAEPSFTLLSMDAGAMALPDASFDLVYSNSCFEHLADPASVMGEVKRVLRPGGVAWISLHLYTSDSGCHDPRIFSGHRDAVPLWAHLRPEHSGKVRPNAYLNEIRLERWKTLFREVLPGAAFEHRDDPATGLDGELAKLRAAGELEEYGDEELLTVDLVTRWSKAGA